MTPPNDHPEDRTNLPMLSMLRPTAQVQPYVDALGADLAVAFLLEFGGAEMSVPVAPNGRSAHEAFLGPEGASRLSLVKDRLQKRVPLAKAWLAAMLDWQGHTVAQIARKLRVSDVSARRMLKGKRQ